MPMNGQLEPRPRDRRRDQGGFVLLTLLFTAAAIAVQLAVSLPRAAMQAQRIREEKLVYRGEQYKRAVELYYRKHQKYPRKLDDLEDTNGVRFLRRRYKDPMTGEDEWRLVHMGSNGRFKNSLVYDTEEEEEEEERLRGFGSDSRSGTVSGSGSAFNSGFRQGVGPAEASPSGRGYAQAAGRTGAAGPRAGAGRPDRLGGYQGASGFGGGEWGQGYLQQPGFSGPDGRFRGADRARVQRRSAAPQIPGRGGPLGDPGQEGDQQESTDPNDPNAWFGAADPSDPMSQDSDYSTMLPSQVPPGAGQRSAYSRQGGPLSGGRRLGGGFGFGPTGAGGFGKKRVDAAPYSGQRPMGFGGQAGSQAANIIGQFLTQPREGGLRTGPTRGGNTVLSEGVAGVASKAEERGVKVYNQRELYNEWEFVFDYREAQGSGAGGGPGAFPASHPTQELRNPASTSGNPFPRTDRRQLEGRLLPSGPPSGSSRRPSRWNPRSSRPDSRGP